MGVFCSLRHHPLVGAAVARAEQDFKAECVLYNLKTALTFEVLGLVC